MTEALSRARALVGPLNPFTLLREERALDAARRADQAVERAR
ncbi:hypothetical protein [Azospirillum canadense]|nr:hypothetical protein [Azospirillum canadense]